MSKERVLDEMARQAVDVLLLGREGNARYVSGAHRLFLAGERAFAPGCVVVGETAVIGDDVSILHEVTLGGTGKERGDRHPKVRDGVLLCAGAKVLGNVEIGRDAKVGAGSVVLHDVPPRATVAGVPARIVGWSSGSVPALEMDQSLPDYEI